jgi:hypothetical protein
MCTHEVQHDRHTHTHIHTTLLSIALALAMLLLLGFFFSSFWSWACLEIQYIYKCMCRAPHQYATHTASTAYQLVGFAFPQNAPPRIHFFGRLWSPHYQYVSMSCACVRMMSSPLEIKYHTYYKRMQCMHTFVPIVMRCPCSRRYSSFFPNVLSLTAVPLVESQSDRSRPAVIYEICIIIIYTYTHTHTHLFIQCIAYKYTWQCSLDTSLSS